MFCFILLSLHVFNHPSGFFFSFLIVGEHMTIFFFMQSILIGPNNPVGTNKQTKTHLFMYTESNTTVDSCFEDTELKKKERTLIPK